MKPLLTGLLACLLVVSPSALQAQTVTVELGETVVAPPMRMGIGVNGGGGWTNFVGAILVDDPSFEGPSDGNGFAKRGWPWYAGGGALTASLDTTDFVTGRQSQRIDVSAAPAHMNQGRDTLPQAPLTMLANPAHTYRIRVQAKAQSAGQRIRLGVMNDSWGRNFGPELALTTEWAVYETDYVPAAEHVLRGVAIGFEDTGSYWVDDLVAWDTDDLDAATGLSATFVARLEELQPESLRLGGLGVNGIPLQSYLREGWDLSYGPPALQPDLDLETFLRLCKRVGADPFITVPPAFSNDTAWQLGDLTDDIIANVYVDHGNLVDYLGGDAATTYGARREAAGSSRWDQQFDALYFELGNEVWGTPDDHWDMDPNGGEAQNVQMQNYATYCERRMNEMKARPGWRANMRVGFGGRSPATWLGGWPGSYDATLVPALSGLLDFSTIDLYYGQGAASDSDAELFGGLFATAVTSEREIGQMRVAFTAANNNVPFETMVYEGNATWGDYEPNLSSPSPLYFKSMSLGAAVSLVDVYAASNRAGVSLNNHFHYGGNVWSATGSYPQVLRKPAFYAVKLLNAYTAGEMVGCTLTDVGTYDNALSGETGVPLVACYPYRDGTTWSVLLVNRDVTAAHDIVIARRFAPVRRVRLAGSDINANNEQSEVVTLLVDTLSGAFEASISETLPPFSATVLVLSEVEVGPQPDVDPDTGPTDVTGSDATTGADNTSQPDAALDGTSSQDVWGDTLVDDGVKPSKSGDDGCGCTLWGSPQGGRAPVLVLFGAWGFVAWRRRR